MIDDQTVASVYKNAALFAKAELELTLHDWQDRFLASASSANYHKVKRRRVAMLAPNSAGKDDRCIAPLALWWLRRYRKGQVVITSADDTQLTLQTWRSLTAHRHRFSDCKWVESPRKRIITPTGGNLLCMTTDEAGRAEGYHLQEPDGPLLMCINEAKSVPDWLFDSWDRCDYNLMLEISSGGYMEGRFYEHFTKSRQLYEWHEITFDQCPHISREKAQQAIEEFGADSPHYQSTILGQFMSRDDSVQHIFELADIESNRRANIQPIHGDIVAAADFGGGIDFNTVLKRDGNHVPDGYIKGWPEANTNAAKFQFIEWFTRFGLEPSQIWADADGLGLGFCCELDAVGWRLNRFHGGSKSPDPRFKHLIAWCWHQTAIQVRKHEIIIPEHPQLIKELSSRRIEFTPDGKIGMETKQKMRVRGVASPNFADVFCMAFGVVNFQARSYLPFDDSNRQEIARRQGWQYSGNEDDARREMYGDGRDSGGRGDWPAEGFGGVHSW